MDPLSVLRQFAVEGRLDSVRAEGGRVAFGDQYSFPARALTRFKGAGGQLLALESAVLFAQHFPQGAAAYVKACQAAGTLPVPVADRRPLRDFLSGSDEPAALARLVDVAEVPVDVDDATQAVAAAGAAAGDAAAVAAVVASASAAATAAAPAEQLAAAAAAADEQAALRLLDAAAAAEPAEGPSSTAAAAAARAAKRARLDAAAPSAGAGAGAAPSAAAALAAPAPQVDAAMAKALRLLAGQERQLRDRNTMLLAPNRAFGRVLQIAEREEADRRRREREREQERQRERAERQQQQAARARPSEAAAAAGGAQQQPSSRPRQDPNAFIKSSGRFEREDAAAGTLRAMAGAVGAPGEGGAADAAAAGLLAADVGLGYGGAEEQQRAQQQQQQQQRTAAPKPPPPPPGGSTRARAPAAAAAAAGAAPAPSARAPSSSAAVPLIIVPAAMSAMLNMWNARQFLEQGQYVPSAEAYKARPERGAPVVAFRRSAGRAHPPLPTYHVTDVVPPARSPDWQRVVAVVVQGKPWQFRDWPFKGAAQGGE
jgi:parafibromin